MEKNIWFKAKEYGYGWYPANWKGWLTLMIFILVVALNFLRIENSFTSERNILIRFIPQSLILVLILILICYLKGEELKWRWGKNKNS